MVRRIAGAVVLSVALASCWSPADIRRHDEAVCAGYGFKPGTEAFAACLQRENLARQYVLQQPYWGPHHYWH